MEWSEDALRLRQFVYEVWCAEGQGPSLSRVQHELGLDRRPATLAYRQLQSGWMVVVHDELHNVPLLKAPPFASFPTDMECHVDGRFHSHMGCAAESTTVSGLPPLHEKAITIQARCACCTTRIVLEAQGDELRSVEPAGTLVHISGTPWEWAGSSMLRVCDTINFVAGPDHAERYERQIGRRGVLLTVAQQWEWTATIRSTRMWDYDFPALDAEPAARMARYEALGVDVSAWTEPS